MTTESASGCMQEASIAISVIIPTRNRPNKLVACLQALAGQAFDGHRFEVIVVDDGSDTPLRDAVEPFHGRLRLVLVEQKNAGPARARNVGAQRAAGALLAFTDDDCEPNTDWLRTLAAAHAHEPSAALGGHTVNALTSNAYSTASQLLVDYLYEHYASAAHGGSEAPPFFTSNNLAVPAGLFRQVGGFDETFPLAAGEDREFCDRWQRQGFSLRHVPGAVIRHSHLLSLRRFWRQHVNYGRGAVHLRKARIARGDSEIKIERLSFYSRLVTYPFRVSRGPSVVVLTGLMALSQVANVFGFARESRRARRG